jgi:hypothetical protein
MCGVVPLAANRAPVDFAMVCFGLAVTVLEEDQESVALDMYFHHHSAADTAKALELARAGERVIETGGKEGYEAFDALRQKNKSEPWYKDVHGDFVFFIMPLDRKQIIDAITHEFNFVEFHTPFHYEPMPALRASTTPQLWVLGSDDLERPVTGMRRSPSPCAVVATNPDSWRPFGCSHKSPMRLYVAISPLPKNEIDLQAVLCAPARGFRRKARR